MQTMTRRVHCMWSSVWFAELSLLSLCPCSGKGARGLSLGLQVLLHLSVRCCNGAFCVKWAAALLQVIHELGGGHDSAATHGLSPFSLQHCQCTLAPGNHSLPDKTALLISHNVTLRKAPIYFLICLKLRRHKLPVALNIISTPQIGWCSSYF